ncbi:MAG: hypothetical protein JJ896_04075 [Rhodothermales bacterium]|nr:hypothetical protein [Rhodothermales bacterium]MBO6778813.1 hypothetical protein [Rhodothermales bacterium]
MAKKKKTQPEVVDLNLKVVSVGKANELLQKLKKEHAKSESPTRRVSSSMLDAMVSV